MQLREDIHAEYPRLSALRGAPSRRHSRIYHLSARESNETDMILCSTSQSRMSAERINASSSASASSPSVSRAKAPNGHRNRRPHEGRPSLALMQKHLCQDTSFKRLPSIFRLLSGPVDPRYRSDKPDRQFDIYTRRLEVSSQSPCVTVDADVFHGPAAKQATDANLSPERGACVFQHQGQPLHGYVDQAPSIAATLRIPSARSQN